jgi:hypothetical protein
VSDVNEIYQRMAVIRREPHTNVRESVAGAEAAADWGRYTWAFPWIALGAAAAAGYLIYTGSHQTGKARSASTADGSNAGGTIAAGTAKVPERSWSGWSLAGAAWDMMFPVAVRAGQNCMLRWLEQQYPTKTVDRAAPSAAGRGAERSVLDGSGQAVGH